MKNVSVVQIVGVCSPIKLSLQTTLEGKTPWKVSDIVLFIKLLY